MEKHSDNGLGTKAGAVQDEKAEDSIPAPKLDRHGYPLRPQPTDDPLGTVESVKTYTQLHHLTASIDPLNWSSSLKLAVLTQVSFLAFLGCAHLMLPQIMLLVASNFQPVPSAKPSSTPPSYPSQKT